MKRLLTIFVRGFLFIKQTKNQIDDKTISFFDVKEK